MPKGVYPHKRRTLQELFLKHVKILDDPDACWIWTGGTNGRYGKMTVHPLSPAHGAYPQVINIYAHRLSYTLYRGDIPDGLEVLHNCPTGDNPLCVNPSHLLLGTHLENITDCHRKERGSYGRKHIPFVAPLPAVKIVCRVWLLCEKCGNPFSVVRSRQDTARFCSTPCSRSSRNKLPLADRFWVKVDKLSSPHGCWLWTACRNQKGYGQFVLGRADGKILAHRMSWILQHGDPCDDLEILHNCPGGDNPACVNPLHLKTGTHAENMRDAGEKGQMSHGENHFSAIITEETAKTILMLFAQGKRQFEIAKQLDLKIPHVHDIVHGRLWKHITIQSVMDT